MNPSGATAQILKSRWFYVLVLAALVGAWGIYSLWWVRAVPEIAESVEAKWNQAIRDLGVEPVYPPEEDIDVGDVFAIVSDDSLTESGLVNSSIANHAVRLWRINLSQEIEDNYKNTHIFDGSAAPKADSVFKLADHRTNLPLVTFPKFLITKSRSASTNDSFYNFGFSDSANSELKTEVAITRTQTYGVPYLVAENALVRFCKELFPPMCKEDAVRAVLSSRIGGHVYDVGIDKTTNKPKYRMTVELGLINRVFMTQAIETHLANSKGFKVSGGRRPGGERALTAGADGKSANQDPSAARQGVGAKAGFDEQLGQAEDESDLAVAFDGTPLDKPVVFGFESVKYSPTPSPIPDAKLAEIAR